MGPVVMSGGGIAAPCSKLIDSGSTTVSSAAALTISA